MKGRLWALLVVTGLSGWSQQDDSPQQQLNRQAHQGNAVAQYRLAHYYWKNDRRTAAHYWWQRAARQQYVPAIEKLFDVFPGAADDWLKLAAAAGNSAAERQLAVAGLTNKNISMSEWQHHWKQTNDPWLKHQLTLLNQYQKTTHCKLRIQVISADQSDKKRYLKFLSAVKNSPFNSDNWCVSWIQDNQLSCTQRSERNRASCHFDNQSGKQVILADKGIASASNRTLTLTVDSSEKVIQHELGHWMGFADEYQMSKSLALEFCYGNYNHESLNIIVTESGRRYSAEQIKEIYHRLPWQKEISSWQGIATQEGEHWRLGSSGSRPIGLYKADTCNAVKNRQAWRPVNITTAMEAHNSGVWPALYLRLLTDSESLQSDSNLSQN